MENPAVTVENPASAAVCVHAPRRALRLSESLSHGGSAGRSVARLQCRCMAAVGRPCGGRVTARVPKSVGVRKDLWLRSSSSLNGQPQCCFTSIAVAAVISPVKVPAGAVKKLAMPAGAAAPLLSVRTRASFLWRTRAGHAPHDARTAVVRLSLGRQVGESQNGRATTERRCAPACTCRLGAGGRDSREACGAGDCGESTVENPTSSIVENPASVAVCVHAPHHTLCVSESHCGSAGLCHGVARLARRLQCHCMAGPARPARRRQQSA